MFLQRISLILSLFIETFQLCSKLQNEITIYPTLGENYEWNMRNLFYSNEEMSFKLKTSPNQFFSIKQPMSEIDSSIMHGQVVSNVISLKPYVNQLTGTWLNSFIMIEEDRYGVDIFFALGNPYEMNKVANFQSYRNVALYSTNTYCYDLDFLSQTQYVIDCIQNEINYFLILDNSTFISNITNEQKLNKPSIRKIIVHTFYYENTNKQYLIRGQYQSDQFSLIEIFQINNLNIESTPILRLDTDSLKQLLSQNDFEFTFVDMQVEPNGDIFILDSLNGIYILNINSDLTWKVKEWNRLNYGEKILAFDFNYMLNNNTKQLVLLFEDKIRYYQDNIFKTEFPLPTLITSSQVQLEISQEYIIYKHSSSVYLYNHKQLLYSFLDDLIDITIVNPYEPDLIAVNDMSSHRYLLSEGILSLKQQQTMTVDLISTILQGIPKTGDTCLITFNIQVIDQSTKLYEMNDLTFPNVVTLPSDAFNVDKFVSGPNVVYQPINSDNNGIEIDIIEFWSLNSTDLISEQIDTFSDIHIASDNHFYILRQFNDKTININKCNHEKFKQTYNCESFSTFVINLQITKDIFKWWVDDKEIIHYIIQESNTLLVFYQIKLNNTEEIDRISTTNQLISFSLADNKLFLIVQNEIIVYIYEFPLKQSFIINSLSQPQKLFGNNNYQLIFIQTQTKLIIGSVSILTTGNTFNSIKELSILEDAEIIVFIGQYHFYLIQKNQSNQSIDEYSLKHLQLITKQKSLPLYDYEISTPIQIDACEKSGWLFIKAQNSTHNFILIYEPFVMSHDSLKKIINVGLIDNNIQVSADGNEQMFLFYSNIIYSILQDSYMEINSNIQSSNFVNTIVSGVIATNNDNKLQIVKTITVLDTHSVPLFSNLKNITYKFVKNSDISIINIDNNLYTGQINNIEIECYQCQLEQPQFSVVLPITTLTSGIDMQYDLIDGQLYDAHYIVYLQTKSLVFQFRNGSFYKIFDMKANITVLETCETLSISQDKKYILVSVLGALSQSILFIECGTDLNCSLVKKLEISDAQRINSVKLMSSNHLFILNSNPTDFSKFNSSILVYTLNSDFTLTTSIIINAKLLNLEQLNIESFDVIKHNTFYSVFFTDSVVGLRINHFSNSQLVYMQSVDEFDLTLYSNDNFYINSDTQFLQVKIINSNQENNIITFQTIIQTSNTAQYIFYLPIDVTLIPKLLKTSIKLDKILTPFGSWQSISKMAYMLNSIIIPYKLNKQVQLLIYQLDKSETQIVSSYFTLHIDYNGILTNSFALVLEIQDDDLNFYTNLEFNSTTVKHLLKKYQLLSQPKIIITNSNKLIPQPIAIKISNYYGSTSGFIYLDQQDDNNPSKNNHLIWLWIALAVFGGILFIAGTVFIIYKYKSEKKKLLIN